MPSELQNRCHTLLMNLGLASAEDNVDAQPLTGGVASDIAVVTIGDKKFCVKFALAKLKVATDWFAPVHRNVAEFSWLKTAAEIAPDSAVKMYGRSETQNGFAMGFLEGDDIYLWKSALLDKAADQGEAAKVGDLLGRIHHASAQSSFDTSPFHNRDDFRSLRIEPYLTYTAQQHRNLAPQFEELSDRLYQADQVLVHGDVSPKNIFLRSGSPIILDAECATMGDASFDPSFCLNHLVLKAVHLPATRNGNLQNVIRFWNAYAPHITWEPKEALESRVCRLLPALMLARVDGKSPVEYLNENEQQAVRDVSRPLVEQPVDSLTDLVARVDTGLKEKTL